MQQQGALIVDYGPAFGGTAARTDKGIVCVVPVQARTRPELKALMREMVTELGGECGHCPNCPLGQQG
ncbi:hypothetical protein [Streptomyces capitiformicae]|uniref:Uncharacterized protein n=1 Tax=Streptomyces capitiformicae TaxID=2014920 RepID=A0A919GNN5_9ACTN|nr:hypothetical protein [Streptomyces capitiformicae]GHH87938.1 hypothetical protein GCM10017771_31170 [Streptomyces capitiformicae]